MELVRRIKILEWTRPVGHIRDMCHITIEISYGDIRGEVQLSVSDDDLNRLERMDEVLFHASQALDGMPAVIRGSCPPASP